jgi:hypothetical protein
MKTPLYSCGDNIKAGIKFIKGLATGLIWLKTISSCENGNKTTGSIIGGNVTE